MANILDEANDDRKFKNDVMLLMKELLLSSHN